MRSKAHIVIMREPCHAKYHPVNCLNVANVIISLGRKGGFLSSTKLTRKSSGSLGRGHLNGMKVVVFYPMYLHSTGDGTLDINEIGSAHAPPPRFLHFIIRIFPVQNHALLPQKSRKPEKSAVESSPARRKFPHSSYSRVRKSGGIVPISSLELNSTRGSATSCEQF